jgi:hypothetical protein
MPPSQERNNSWIAEATKGIIHPVALLVTPLVLVILLLRLVVLGFGQGADAGIRSLAGALLPLLCLTFVYLVARRLYALMTSLPLVVSFGIAVVWGMTLLTFFEIFGTYMTVPFPVREVLLSTSLGLLIFGSVGGAQQKPFAYHYGMLCGFLVYLMIFGVPTGLLPK